MTITQNSVQRQAETVKKKKSKQKPDVHDISDRERKFDEMMPPKLPFHVLGFNAQRQILIWYKGKILPTPISQLRKDELKLLVGLLPSSQQDKTDQYEEIKLKIIALAHSKGLVDDEEPIKSGIWKFKNDWVIVSGKKAALIQNGELSFLETPLVNGRTIEFERTSWIDLDRLKERLPKSNLSDTFKTVKALTSQWNWADAGMADFVSAFIMLQLFQYALIWRPWIYLLGAAHTGKSFFLEHVLERLMGSLIKRMDKSTGHATAQAVGWSGRIPVFDEFEKNKHMADVLETLKLGNRGIGMKTSGTTGDKHKEYSLHHQPWFASIYLPKTFSSDQAQLSRVVKFELKKAREGKSLQGLSDSQAQDLLCDIVASVISDWSQIEDKAREIEGKKDALIKDCDGKISVRTVDNFMYSMALLSCVQGTEQKIPGWAIGEVKDDGENILESIIMAKIKYGITEFLVIDLIHKVLGELINIENITEATAKDLLRNHGLSVVKKSTGWCLAIRCKDVRESLFKFHSDYQNVDISAPLERFDGAEKGIKTEWGQSVKQRALHIPGRHINTITGAE